jgi:hypothetical protein
MFPIRLAEISRQEAASFADWQINVCISFELSIEIFPLLWRFLTKDEEEYCKRSMNVEGTPFAIIRFS